MAEEPQEGVSRRQQFVTDPFGTPVPVPPGMTVQDVIKQIERAHNNDPKLRGEAMRQFQLREGQELPPTDPRARRAHLASQVDGPVEPGDIQDFMVRFDLARSDLATEKMMKLREYLPDHELKLANDFDGNPTILYRAPGQSSYREVEAPEFSVGDIAALAEGALSPDVAAEIVAFMGTRAGTSTLKGMARAFTAGVGGEALDIGIEKARGFEQSETGPLVEQLLTTGTAGAVGYGFFDPIARVINTMRGRRGVIIPSESAAKAMRIAKDQDLPPLLPGQVFPLFESMQQQSAASIQAMEEFQLDMFQKAVTRFSDIRDQIGDFRSLTDDALEKVLKKEERKILASINVNPQMTFANAGRKVHKGLQDFNEALSEREGRAYTAAFKASNNVRFNLQPAQQVAASIRNKLVTDINFKDLPMSVHVPLTPVENNSFREALSNLVNLNPEVTLTAGNASPVEQMIRLRSTFFNLAHDERLSGVERASSRTIHSVLTEIMRNPRNLRGKKGNLKPSVARAWRRAASLSTSRERFNQRVLSRFTALSDEPSKIAKKLSLNNPDLVKETRRTMLAAGNNTGWSSVQTSYKNALLQKPSRIRSIIRGADKQTLDLLVPKADQQHLLTISDQWSRMEKSHINKMLRKGTDIGRRTLELIESGTRLEIQELITEAGGKGSPTHKALQAGVIESLLERSTHNIKDRTIIKKETFLSGLKDMRRRGVLDEIFDPGTQNSLIEDLETYVAFLPKGTGVGEGIQRAEIASGVARGKLSAIINLGKNRLIAWAFISPGARRFIIGAGKDPKKGVSTSRLGAIGAAMAVIFDNMDENAKSGSFDTSEEDIVPDIF